MKAIFLASSLGGYIKTEIGRIATHIENSNGFVDRLKHYSSKWKNFVMIASNPDVFEKTDEYANIFFQAFNLDGFGIENFYVIDHRFKGDIKETIHNADVVLFTGGHTPTQNKYLKEINIKEILRDFDGILIGQSAGSMNMAETVYCPPDYPEDLTNDYQKTFSGVGLTPIRVMPHLGSAYDDNVDGNGKNTIDFCLEDSYSYPMYGIYDYCFIEIANGTQTAFGKTLLIKDGKCTEICDFAQSIILDKIY